MLNPRRILSRISVFVRISVCVSVRVYGSWRRRLLGIHCNLCVNCMLEIILRLFVNHSFMSRKVTLPLIVVMVYVLIVELSLRVIQVDFCACHHCSSVRTRRSREIFVFYVSSVSEGPVEGLG